MPVSLRCGIFQYSDVFSFGSDIDCYLGTCSKVEGMDVLGEILDYIVP